jgi:hypothetical protein
MTLDPTHSGPSAFALGIRLSSQSDDDRVRYMASAWVYEHAWGKPKDYDPASEKPDRPAFNPRDYTPEQLAVIEAALKLMRAGGSAPAEPEVIPPGDR